MPLEAVRTLIGRGRTAVSFPGTRFISVQERAADRAASARGRTGAPRAADQTAVRGGQRHVAATARKPAFLSLLAHATLVLLAVWLSTGRTETAPLDDSIHEESHLVFLLSPGPGGGGGGGGLRQPRPAPEDCASRRIAPAGFRSSSQRETGVLTTRARKRRSQRPSNRVVQPQPPEPAPEPVPAKVIVAPVETVAANDRDREGAIEHAVDGRDSNGPAATAASDPARARATAKASDPGIGDGEGGGTGGGPYRPGSGIEPPRLLREVKAEYTEDARRRGITGDVLLEIVVRRDGSVGDVHVLQGLGAGLDERAIAAVRQWRFDAARRKGVPVDVLVEVAVEFTLR